MVVRGEDLHLLLGGEAGVERQDLDALGVMLAEHLGGVADVAFAREEDEGVAWAGAPELIDGPDDGLLLLVVLLVDGGLEWAIEHVDWVGAAFDVEDGCAAEVFGEALGGDGGAGDDELQVRPARQQALEVADEEIDVERALVGLVEDDGVVLPEHAVGHDLGEQDAVGHELHEAGGGDVVGEAHLEADEGANVGVELLGEPAGDRPGGDAAGLGMADHAVDAAAELEADLGQLGGLARAGGTAEDDDLVVADGLGDLRGAGRDGELGGVVDPRPGLLALGGAGGRGVDRLRDALEKGEDSVLPAGEHLLTGDAQVSAQVRTIREHGSVEPTEQVADQVQEIRLSLVRHGCG